MKPTKSNPGERISKIAVTVGVNFGRVGFDAARDADMSWLACPRCGEAPCACERAAQYEARRAAILAGVR